MHFPSPTVWRSLSVVFAWLAISLAAGFEARAADRYVSISGVDTNAGTMLAPWRNIQKAANSALPGDTVYIRGGTYAESVMVGVSGTVAGGFITFRAYAGETVIIDGTSVPVVEDKSNALIHISDRNYLIFQGLEIRNYFVSTEIHSDVLGILIDGTSHHVEIRNCKIHHIQATGLADGNANGIAVYGEGTTAGTAMTNIIIDGCEVYNLKTRWSESVVVNGNVDGFQITNCVVHDNDNIGIDCIGFEGTSEAADTSLDQARNGLVRGNHVYNIDSGTNPAYGGDQAADGIYVDGGRDIVIEANTVHDCNIGIEVASEELGKVASNVIVRNNFIYRNHIVGMYLGGSGNNNGGAQNCRVTNNTLFQNDTLNNGSGQLELQRHCTGITIAQNIIWGGVNNIMVINPNGTATDGHVIDRNLYFANVAAGATEWNWNGVDFTGFAAWKSASGKDSSSTFANPAFVSTGSPLNLHLQATSPARNGGNPAYVPALGEGEIDGQQRVTESMIDLGADEFVPTVSISATDANAAEWLQDAGSFTITRTAGNGTNLASAPLNVAITMTGTATNGVDYTLISSVVIPSAATSALVTLTPTLDNIPEGPETAMGGIVSVPGAHVAGSPASATITISDRPLDQWKFTQFGINAGNAVIAGETADPDGDGRRNFLEYATGTNPLVANAGPELTFAKESGYLTATLARSASPVDVTLAGEVATGLSGWSSAGVTVMENTPTKFKFRDSSLMSVNSRRFLRAKVMP